MDHVNVHKTHPLITGAAIAVILTCLLAIGVMTGIVPSPMNRGADREDITAPTAAVPAPTTSSSLTTRETSPSGTTTTRESRTVTREPAHEPRRLTSSAPQPAPAPATGATYDTAPAQTVAGSAPAPAPRHIACSTCGTVTSVRAVKQQGEASMIGPAAGALLGGVLGRQVGGGTGRTIATVVGAGAGAAAGTEVERRYKSTTQYVVAVRMNDGSSRSFNYASDPGVAAGEHVRVEGGQLVRN
jgi:outer membrane lipoprotein SlyB